MAFREQIPVDRMSFPTLLTPTSLRAPHGFLSDEARSSHCLAVPVLPGHDPFLPTPCRLAATGFHLGLRSTLKFCSQPRVLRSTTGFTPQLRQRLSWPFSPSGFCSMTALGVNPPLLGVATPRRFFCSHGWLP